MEVIAPALSSTSDLQQLFWCRDLSPFHTLVSSGLTDTLSSMLEAHVQVAAGNAADEKGFLLQVTAASLAC